MEQNETGKQVDTDKMGIPDLVAAVLTLSEGVDALHDVLRKNLSFQVDMYENKLHKDFVPPRLKRTQARYEEWKKDNSE